MRAPRLAERGVAGRGPSEDRLIHSLDSEGDPPVSEQRALAVGWIPLCSLLFRLAPFWCSVLFRSVWKLPDWHPAPKACRRTAPLSAALWERNGFKSHREHCVFFYFTTGDALRLLHDG